MQSEQRAMEARLIKLLLSQSEQLRSISERVASVEQYQQKKRKEELELFG